MNILKELNQVGGYYQLGVKRSSKIRESIAESVSFFPNNSDFGERFIVLGVSKGKQSTFLGCVVSKVTKLDAFKKGLVSQCAIIRNANIAAVFHDTNLAETKGTGFRTMEKLMKASEMVPPTYESHHHRNSFVLRLLLHHFLNEHDLKWLANFQQYRFSDTQKIVLVFLREVGAIDNLSYRQLTGLSNMESSVELRKLRKEEMIIRKGGGKSTYYLPSELFETFLSTQNDGLSTQVDGLSTRADRLSTQADGLSTEIENLSTQAKFKNLPKNLIDKIEKLGKRTKNPKQIEDLIVEICKAYSFSISELAQLLKRSEKYLKNDYLGKMIDNNILEYTIPQMISHPNQKYKTVRKSD